MVEAVEEKAREHLRRKRRSDGKLLVEDRSPSGVLLSSSAPRRLREGRRDRALDDISAIIKEMVLDVAAGNVMAEAKELDQNGRAPPRKRKPLKASRSKEQRATRPASRAKPMRTPTREPGRGTATTRVGRGASVAFAPRGVPTGGEADFEQHPVVRNAVMDNDVSNRRDQ